MSDVLLGLAHLIRHSNFQLPSIHGIGGANSTPSGKPFEVYCKDWLSLLPPNSVIQRQTFYNNAFSFQGADNNPPDVMYKGGNLGDAFEFKKTESPNSAIPLNSSFPKNMLYKTSPGLLVSCINCESWTQRSFYYIVGRIKPGDQRISYLWVVDGKFMATDHVIYENVFNNLKTAVSGVVQNNNLVNVTSKELGRIKQIDPLDRSTLRVRSMWELETPQKSFANLPGVLLDDTKSVLHALILESKWNQYPAHSRSAITSLVGTPGFSLQNITNAPDPSNKNNFLTGKLIRFES
jgi:hypothetical protein